MGCRISPVQIRPSRLKNGVSHAKESGVEGCGSGDEPATTTPGWLLLVATLGSEPRGRTFDSFPRNLDGTVRKAAKRPGSNPGDSVGSTPTCATGSYRAAVGGYDGGPPKPSLSGSI